MNNSQVAHIWAQNNNETAHGSNFYCEGGTIYSYGQHFPIARFTNGVCLFTNQTYSITTSQHISKARNALYFSPIMVNDIDATPQANHDHMKASIQAEAVTLSRRRTALDFWFRQYMESIKSANAYNTLFKLRRKMIDAPDSIEQVKGMTAGIIEKAKRKAKADKARNAKAGCHRIEYSESLRFATAQAWT